MVYGKVSGYKGDRPVTKLEKATTFYPAHKEHQMYLQKNPDGECNHFIRFEWPQEEAEREDL